MAIQRTLGDDIGAEVSEKFRPRLRDGGLAIRQLVSFEREGGAMFRSRGWSFIVAALALIACGASAQKIVPSPLLAIDQNRSTVVERIVNQWGDSLAASNAGITASQLREILTGLRSDHLLAASLAGNVEGLRNVVASALVQPESVVSRPVAQDFHATFGLGDQQDDKHIDGGDSIGVALAAIQGLHQMMRQKDREIALLKARGDALERDLVAIKAKLAM